jgi:hypothetical protein
VGFSNHYRVLALGPAVVYGVAVRYLVAVGGETFPLERTEPLEEGQTFTHDSTTYTANFIEQGTRRERRCCEGHPGRDVGSRRGQAAELNLGPGGCRTP